MIRETSDWVFAQTKATHKIAMDIDNDHSITIKLLSTITIQQKSFII